MACILNDDSIFPMLDQTQSTSMGMVDTITEGITSEGDRALIVWSNEPNWPHVYEHTPE